WLLHHPTMDPGPKRTSRVKLFFTPRHAFGLQTPPSRRSILIPYTTLFRSPKRVSSSPETPWMNRAAASPSWSFMQHRLDTVPERTVREKGYFTPRAAIG